MYTTNRKGDKKYKYYRVYYVAVEFKMTVI